MHPTLFKLGGLPLHAYGLLVALGFLAGILVTINYAKKEKIAAEAVLDLAIYVIIAAIVGARIFYVLGQLDHFLANPLEIVMVQNGGLVFLGGLFLSFLVVVLYAKKKKLNLIKLLDAITPGVALGYALGRLGCFLNGCCFGLPTSLPFGVIFPPDSLAGAYCPGERLHPTQLYSALTMLLVFFFLIWLYRRKRYNGQVLYWGLILYSVYRFLVEFLRFSPVHILLLTPSQWLVIITFILGVVGLLKNRKS